MLLTLTTTYQPAIELGYLVAKHPDRVQHFSLSFGTAYVFHPEATPERCTIALLLEIDPVGLVRRRNPRAEGLLDQDVIAEPEANAVTPATPELPTMSLHEQRLIAVTAALKATGATRILDLGCGEGRLIHHLLNEPQFHEIVGEAFV